MLPARSRWQTVSQKAIRRTGNQMFARKSQKPPCSPVARQFPFSAAEAGRGRNYQHWRETRRSKRAAGMGAYAAIEVRGAPPHRESCGRVEGTRYHRSNAVLPSNHRHPGESRRHAEGGFSTTWVDAAGARGNHSVSGQGGRRPRPVTGALPAGDGKGLRSQAGAHGLF